MDFAFTPEQDDAAALAAQILDARVSNDRQKQVERAGDRFDRELWSALGEAGLKKIVANKELDLDALKALLEKYDSAR